MRIECEKCNAAFTIGDDLLSDQPIGAQCPYCGQVKVVTRGAAPASSAGGAPASLDLSGSLGGPPSGSGSLGGPPSGGGASAPSAIASSAPSNPSRLPSFSNDAGGFDALGLPPTGLDLGGGGAGDLSDLGPDESVSATCQVCGTPLVDEFDKVIGLCETHQRDRSTGDSGVQSVPELPATPEPVEPAPAPQDGARAELGTAAIPGPPPRTYIAPAKRRGGGFGRGLLLLIVAGVVGGVGYYGYLNQTKVEAMVADLTDLVGNAPPPKPPPANPLLVQIDAWRDRFPNVSGTPDEHVRVAMKAHKKDTAAGYRKAQVALQKALLLNHEAPSVVGLYVENLVYWRGPLLSQAEFRTAEAASDYAVELAPNDPAGYRAKSALDLVRGDLAGSRTWADKARAIAPGDAATKLLAGESFIRGNVKEAIGEIESVRTQDPDLRRADGALARAYLDAGRFGSAAKVLQERLRGDPKNVEILLLRGELAFSMGLYTEARKYFNRAIRGAGNRDKARLRLARTEYDLGSTREAAALWAKVAKQERLPARYLAEANTGLAQVQVRRERWAQGAQYAKRAMTYDPRSAAALLAAAEVALGTRSATTAEMYARRSLELSSGEPAALVVIGRSHMHADNADAALVAFEEAIRNDPKDPRLKGLLAAMYLRFGGSSQAFAVMRKVADIDPQDNGRLKRGLLSVSLGAQNEAIAAFRKVTNDRRNSSVAHSSIGVMLYHLGQRPRAQVAITAALKADDSNIAARLYEAQIALERGALGRAEESARTILDIDRGSAMGHLMLGRIYERKGSAKEAVAAYESALRSSPGLMVAKVELAGLRHQAGEAEEALSVLTQAFEIYPQMASTRRLLFRIGY